MHYNSSDRLIMKKKTAIYDQCSRIKKLNIKFWLIILFIVYIVYCSSMRTYENYRLKKEGICTNGIIYERGSRSGYFYEFKVEQKYYRGSTTSASDISKEIGDSIIIIYLPSDPNINRSQIFLDMNCAQD